MEPLVFEKSVSGRIAARLPDCDVPHVDAGDLLGSGSVRETLDLPEMSELDVVRHFTRLSHRNYAIDLGFYPLGSCTMKYNPKVHEMLARLDGFTDVHPLQPEETAQGALTVIHAMERILAEIAGMEAACLQPAAGAHGELVSLMMVRQYHRSRGDTDRNVILVADSAHGTNPASAARCGFSVRSVPSNDRGLTDLGALRSMLDGSVAALMLTNPNTLGLFESDVQEICRLIHEAGGLMYCDGANMNAIVGVARPGDMGFDVMHFNLHKTFSTPHGGGGPGCGAIAVGRELEPFLPVPRIADRGDGQLHLEYGRPHTIGRAHSFYGAFLVAVRAYAYIRSLGAAGLRQVAETAVLNANYVRARLRGHYEIPHDRTCMHEVVISASRQKSRHGVRALDISKRLMDYGFHPPTNYFPLVVPEALMIEPTETESRETLDAFCDALIAIARECETEPDLVRSAPHTTVVSRLDETAAVKQLNVRWTPPEQETSV
ncbi:MAG: aminomethyl-transferring glycine dehydrogenase subunit GcvPB [Chthonomonadales bacterium]|nr:aminomethyl-transferring glycine dehydrogenase subunit GcvPB [Chthonomonadales bacterium]